MGKARRRVKLADAVQAGQDNGLAWHIPIKLAALAAPDLTEARRASRLFGGAGRIAMLDQRPPGDPLEANRASQPTRLGSHLAPVVAGELHDNAPEYRFSGTALKVAGEIGRRLKMDQGLESQSGWLWVRVAYSSLAGWTSSARSSVQQAVDRLSSGEHPIIIKRRQYQTLEDGRRVCAPNLYRIAWWARDLFGLQNPDLDGQAVIPVLAEESLEAPAPPPMTGLQAESVMIAAVVEGHISQLWAEFNQGKRAEFNQRAGYGFSEFREAQWDQYRERPSVYLLHVFRRQAEQESRKGRSDRSRPPPEP